MSIIGRVSDLRDRRSTLPRLAWPIRLPVKLFVVLACLTLITTGATGCGSAHPRPLISPPASPSSTPPNLSQDGHGPTIVAPRFGTGPTQVKFTAPSNAFFVAFWCVGPGTPTLAVNSGPPVPFAACKQSETSGANFGSSPGSEVVVMLHVSAKTKWEVYISQYPMPG
jgi:hypothetical protein